MYIYLSHPLNNDTPTYGNRMEVNVKRLKSIDEGSTVNESFLELPLHAGTHIDYPLHFYKEGQTHLDFPASFWVFDKPLLLNICSDELIIENQIIEKLNDIQNKDSYDLVLIKTGASEYRGESKYWEYNHGLSPLVAIHIKENFPSVRCVGMDFISLSSFQHSSTGKQAHLEFLNPKDPIIIIEDMNLSELTISNNIVKVIVAPVRIDESDGVPVSCLAEIED